MKDEDVKIRQLEADSVYYEKSQLAAANKLMYAAYSPEYVQLETARALANNSKFYYSGQDSLLYSVVNKVLKGLKDT